MAAGDYEGGLVDAIQDKLIGMVAGKAIRKIFKIPADASTLEKAALARKVSLGEEFAPTIMKIPKVFQGK